MLRNRKWWIVIGAVALMTLLSGCSPSTQTSTTDQMAESSSWWIRNVVYWFSYMLDTFAKWFDGQYVFAILLLTVIVRTIILPLMIKQYNNTKAMQALQPEMKQIREKYKDDPRKQQEEMMKLYQTHQVNPLAGCLPLIIQMPIFIALYNSIYMNEPIREDTFLGLKLGISPQEAGAAGWYYYVIPLIAAITTYIQSKMMSAQQQVLGPMKGLMMVFPVLIFVMAINFAVALPLYWIFSNVYTIVQNYFMYVRRSSKPEEKPQPKKSGGKAGGKGKKGAHAK